MKKYMTIEEVAAYLQLSRETLYKYVQRGVVPAIKIGRHWRFDAAALDAFITSQTRVRPQVGETAASPVLSSRPKKQLRVLIVDDDTAIVKLLSVWICAEGHLVETAANGHQAMDRLTHSIYDMLFLDLHMPDLTGGQVLGRLEEYSVRPPVVLITGFSETPLMEQALEYDLLYVLSKPFDRKQVLHLLTAAVAERYLFSSQGPQAQAKPADSPHPKTD